MDTTCLLIGHPCTGGCTNEGAYGVEEIHEKQGEHHNVILDIQTDETREINMESDRFDRMRHANQGESLWNLGDAKRNADDGHDDDRIKEGSLDLKRQQHSP